jgi:hypothetical protein
MKTVFSNSDLVHTFAQQIQEEGRTSNGSIFFYGKKIYSYGYHYLLGEIIDSKTIIINDRGYSSSTGKHISMLSSATRQYKQYFYSEVDLHVVYNSIKENYNSLGKTKKPGLYIMPIIAKFESLSKFLKLYKKTNDLKSDKFKEIKKIYNSLKKDEDKYVAQLKEVEKKRVAKELAKFNKDLDKFFNHETNRLYTNVTEDYLRISLDKSNVETTQGVSIPVENALTLYNMIEAGKDIRGYRIDSYTVISLNGHLKIGCHNINVKNMHKVGKELKTISSK